VFHEPPIEMSINAKEKGGHQEWKKGGGTNDDDRNHITFLNQ
jgi:hypothetical protein